MKRCEGLTVKFWSEPSWMYKANLSQREPFPASELRARIAKAVRGREVRGEGV